MKLKRIRGYVIDLLLSLAICIVLSIFAIMVMAVITLLFLPFVLSYEDTWNPILSAILNGMLLLGVLVFMVMSLGVNLKSTLTWGYKTNGLIIENTSKFRLFTWWFIRNGIVGLFIFVYAYLFGNDMDYNNQLFIPIFIYIIYLGIDGVVFLYTNGKRTFTDIWTGIRVVETGEVTEMNFPWSRAKQ